MCILYVHALPPPLDIRTASSCKGTQGQQSHPFDPRGAGSLCAAIRLTGGAASLAWRHRRDARALRRLAAHGAAHAAGRPRVGRSHAPRRRYLVDRRFRPQWAAPVAVCPLRLEPLGFLQWRTHTPGVLRVYAYARLSALTHIPVAWCTCTCTHTPGVAHLHTHPWLGALAHTPLAWCTCTHTPLAWRTCTRPILSGSLASLLWAGGAFQRLSACTCRCRTTRSDG
eukprot:3061703-Prymnesium_polylepis.2